MNYIIRTIEAKDNKEVETIIRNCLIEYGGNHEGTAWADPDLCRFSEIYNTPGNRYWVAETEDGRLLGGTGIGQLKGDVCELQKMYTRPEARGTGAAQALLDTALNYAKGYYKQCYLETLDNMTRAQKFYEKNGFRRIYETIPTLSQICATIPRSWVMSIIEVPRRSLRYFIISSTCA